MIVSDVGLEAMLGFTPKCPRFGSKRGSPLVESLNSFRGLVTQATREQEMLGA